MTASVSQNGMTPPLRLTPVVSNHRLRQNVGHGTFADVFGQVHGAKESLHVSAHAAARMAERGVQMSTRDWLTVGQAVAKAEQKGARDAYVMYGNTGFVINVPNRTVVTTLATQSETIVTNVDSVVVVPRPDH